MITIKQLSSGWLLTFNGRDYAYSEKDYEGLILFLGERFFNQKFTFKTESSPCALIMLSLIMGCGLFYVAELIFSFARHIVGH